VIDKPIDKSERECNYILLVELLLDGSLGFSGYWITQEFFEGGWDKSELPVIDTSIKRLTVDAKILAEILRRLEE